MAERRLMETNQSESDPELPPSEAKKRAGGRV